MPALGRNGPALLRQVNNKPHATRNDHEEDSLPTPPASNNTRRNGAAVTNSTKKQEEDIYADPVSSSDDEEDAPALPTADKGAGFRPSKQIDGANDLPANKSTFKAPAGLKMPGSTLSKRSNSNDDDNEDPEFSDGSDDKMVFDSSQQSQSPRKKARLLAAYKARAAGNIHAPPPAKKSNNTYGKKTPIFTSKNRKAAQPQTSGFKTAKGSISAAPKPQAPTFRTAKGADVFTFGPGNDAAAPAFQAPRGGVPDSPELSELSEPDSEVEEIDVSTLDLPLAKKWVARTNCGICQVSVPLLLRQEFEDRYTHGKALDYKWQQRFCRYHKADAAKEVWQERGYPEIKWEGLGERLQRHHSKLLAVLKGETSSVYRDRLQKVVDSGTTKSAASAFHKAGGGGDESEDLEIKPGYYGPRGEKVMTEHILNDFSKELRNLSVKDRLLAASGVAGGVSGFVQAVLVPEVAVLLVKEDMSVDVHEARGILAKSWELGELLNEEADEKVEKIDDSEDEDD